MHYPPHIPESRRFAVGHEAFGLVPGLMMYATIWLREHNRVCDILKQEHPDWDDERLFQTARLILIGKIGRFRSIFNVDNFAGCVNGCTSKYIYKILYL